MIVISWLVWRRGWLKRPGAIIGVFFLGYGLGRTFVEGFRQADLQFVTDENPWGHIVNISGSGYDAVGLTMGQLLSLPMVVIGAVILYYRWPRKA